MRTQVALVFHATLSQSLQRLVEFLGDIQHRGVDLYLHRQNIDTSMPSDKVESQMVGVFAEFERAMIQERVKVELARARQEGKILGRPKVSVEIEGKIRDERKNGHGMLKNARTLGLGVSTVQRLLAV